MLAMAIDGFGPPETVCAVELPRPVPSRGDVLVRVVAAGVNPIDGRICRGDFRERLPHKFPLIPGWDVAGVVEEQGEGASGRFRTGDRVWACARKALVQHGCYAEYVALPERQLALMPSKLLFEEAAAVPVAGLAAYRSLFGETSPDAGSKILVLGAAGGIGHLAVQLAKYVGSEVAGTAPLGMHGFLSTLGIDAPVDGENPDWPRSLARFAPDGFDVIVDAGGGEELEAARSLLSPRGRLAESVEAAVEPSADRLERLAGLIDKKKLSPHVEKIYPIAEAAQAVAASLAGTRGKLVLAL